MYDIHCHVLPNVDDGPNSMEIAMSMIELAYDQGTRHMVLTPHLNHPLKFKPFNHEKVFQSFQESVEENIPGMTLYFGMENYISRGKLKKINQIPIVTINDSKYILVEFSRDISLSEMDHGLYELKLLGYKPIIAHIEVYSKVIENDEFMCNIRKEGYLFQINANHLFEGKSSKIIKKLAKNKMIDFIASDCHGLDYRPPMIQEAYEWLVTECGLEQAERIFNTNPLNMLNNEPIDIASVNKASHQKSRVPLFIVAIFIVLVCMTLSGFLMKAPKTTTTNISSLNTENKSMASSESENFEDSLFTHEKNKTLMKDLRDKADTYNSMETSSATADIKAANELNEEEKEAVEEAVEEANKEVNKEVNEKQIETEKEEQSESKEAENISADSAQNDLAKADTLVSHEESLVSAYISYLEELEALYTQLTTNYYMKLKDAIDIQDKDLQKTRVEGIKEELGTMEIQVDNEVNKTLYDMQNDLEDYDYSVEVIQELRDHYFDTKESISTSYKAELKALYESRND